MKNKPNIQEKVDQTSAELEDLRTESFQIIQRIQDVLEEDGEELPVDEALAVTIEFYRDFVDHLEELQQELNVNRMFSTVALARAHSLKKKIRPKRS